MAVWKRRDTGKWVCDFRHNGRRHLQTLKLARTKKDAEEAEAVIMADVFRQVYGLNGKEDSPFDKFVLDKFLPYSEANKRTFYDDMLVCKVLIGYFKAKMLRSITPALVEEFKQKRLATPVSRQKDRVAKNWTPSTRLKKARQKREESDEPPKPRKPATVNREMCVLSKIFSLAVDAELLDDNPCRRVKKLRTANQRVRYLTDAEEKELFKALEGQDWVKDIIVMAINTGMRRGELFDLKWFDVDLNRRIVHVRQSKSGRPRTIPLNATTQTLLAGLPKTSQYVFQSPKKNERRVNDVGRQFERAVKKAKIVDFHFHDLRHTAATRMADAGADPFTLAAILGHSDIRMTARYTHATDEAKRRAVDRLVKPASISDASEAAKTQLRAVENCNVASGLEIFSNVLATETKTARIASP
ncbi:MAG TPA: site-specific integrase [Pyrinomonadaceae bacterium]|jgi:integrase|nr:site-specific integrase [Pyrinomonadaceae bacterium]